MASSSGRLTGPGGLGELGSASESSSGVKSILRTQTECNLGESIFDSNVVSALILLILRVANEVEQSNPRVAYLCKNARNPHLLLLNY